MKIYFAAAMRGGRDNLKTNQQIVAYLSKLGHEILTLHVTNDDFVQSESEFSDRQIHDRDMRMLAQANALVAEATTPSLGTGYEIAEALRQNIPVLCLYRTDMVPRLSPLIAGNPNPLFTVVGYTSDRWQPVLDTFLQLVARRK
ncbi:MAG: nucleoside 2-deoxyribosyltransferase [Patescibacteria group bacterium]|nr:nucleoside 2-deoxyribosyltransferase [Patescibacteria group bacterium]